MPQKHPAPMDLDRGLLALYLNGDNSVKASELTGVPQSTLRYWRKEHAERYDEIAAKHGPELDKVILSQLHRSIIRSGDVLELALEKTYEQLENDNVKDASTVARNLAVARGVDIDKGLLIQGRPTQISEHRDIGDIIRSLESVAPGVIVDSTATELT